VILGPSTLGGRAVGAQSDKNLVLAAMVFAVAMTVIDQTIVAIAVPDVQRLQGASAAPLCAVAASSVVAPAWCPRGQPGRPPGAPDVLEPQPTEMEA
jgi:hypothetical protein